MFRGKFLAYLGAAFRNPKLRFTGAQAHLKKAAEFDRFVRHLRGVNWFVYSKRPFGGPEHVIKYPARYPHRVAIANGRLLEMRDGPVTFRWRDSADNNTQKLRTLDAAEFTRRYLLHVLPPGFVKIRHFGFLANRNRCQARRLCRSLLPAAPDPKSTPLTDMRCRAVERKCPRCQISRLPIIDWIPAPQLLRLGVNVRLDTS